MFIAHKSIPAMYPCNKELEITLQNKQAFFKKLKEVVNNPLNVESLQCTVGRL